MRPLAVAALALALAACPKNRAREPGADDPTQGQVVAMVNGEPITHNDLESALPPEYRRKERELFESRRQALEGLITRRLVLAEAKKVDVSEDDFLKQYIEAKVIAPIELDAKAFYDNNPQLMRGQPYEVAKPQILEFLKNQRQAEVAQALFTKLRAAAKVEVHLKEPVGMRVSVAAVGPSRGPDDAAVTIVEFSDFQCPYCSRATKTVEKVIADYAGKVRLVFRDFPLQFHEHAFKAAEAGHCAHAQGKFWPLHDKMFDNQQRLEVPDLKRYARAVGLSGEEFDRCLDSGKYAGAVRDNLAAGEKAGVTGTPAFFVNGRLLSGALPYDEFRAVVESELARLANR